MQDILLYFKLKNKLSNKCSEGAKKIKRQRLEGEQPPPVKDIGGWGGPRSQSRRYRRAISAATGTQIPG